MKNNKAIEVKIEDATINNTTYKLAKIYKKGRVYAAHFNRPELTIDEVWIDYTFNPYDFKAFNESTGLYC